MAPTSQGRTRRAPAWTGALLALAAVLAAEGFAALLPADAQPFHRAGFLLVLAAVIASAWRGGLRGALAAGLVGAAGIAHLFLVFGGPLGPPAVRLTVGGTIGGFGLALATLIGHLRDRERRAVDALLEERAAIEASNRALAAANETLEAFTYVTSHDLKEPVRALESYSQALREDHGDLLAARPEANALAARIGDNAARLRHLIEGLLDYSRASRIAPHDLEPTRVEDALRSPDCRARYDHAMAERGARLATEPGPPVLASAAGLCQVLGNLVLNAVKHNDRPGAVVRVRSHASRDDPSLVEVVVEDDGPGFPAPVLRAFGQARGGRPSTIQGGFGLIITRQAVEKMGGTMWLGNRPEGGGAARFTLPAAPTPERSEAAAERTPPPVGRR